MIKPGDLVKWVEGAGSEPGIVLETRPSRLPPVYAKAMWDCHKMVINPTGIAVLAMLPELDNGPEWFHECELEKVK